MSVLLYRMYTICPRNLAKIFFKMGRKSKVNDEEEEVATEIKVCISKEKCKEILF